MPGLINITLQWFMFGEVKTELQNSYTFENTSKESFFFIGNQFTGTYRTGLEKLHRTGVQLSERYASLGIMEVQLRVSQKPIRIS